MSFLSATPNRKGFGLSKEVLHDSVGQRAVKQTVLKVWQCRDLKPKHWMLSILAWALAHCNVCIDLHNLCSLEKCPILDSFRGPSITTWTRRRGEGISQMSTIVDAREGGGLRNVHVDKIFGKMQFFAASVIGRWDVH